MMGSAPILMKIITPEHIVYSQKINHAIIPTIDAKEGIYINHIPFLTMLTEGDIKLYLNNNEILKANIKSGMAQFRDNILTILTHNEPAICEIAS